MANFCNKCNAQMDMRCCALVFNGEREIIYRCQKCGQRNWEAEAQNTCSLVEMNKSQRSLLKKIWNRKEKLGELQNGDDDYNALNAEVIELTKQIIPE